MADPSLIAKPNIDYTQPAHKSKSAKAMGVLVFISFLFFLIIGLLYGGAYFYHQRAVQILDGLTRELAQLEEDLDPDIINEIARVDRGLATARSLLAQHIYTSNVFDILEQHTLRRVYYTSFEYDFSGSGEIAVRGQTENFLLLHQQLQQLRSLPLVTAVELQDVQLADAAIEFSITITLDRNVFRYR